MSTSRAIRPLFEVGSRLIVDQFFPRSAGIATPKRLFSSASLQTASPRICWSCRHDYAVKRQQLRFSSSSTPKPPNDDRGNEHKSQNDAPTQTSSSSSSSSPSSHSTTTDAHSQESPLDSPPQIEQEQNTSQTQPPSSSAADPDLPSAQNSRRSALNQSLSSFMDRAQTTLFAASQRINDLTGYSSIESLKSQISTLESDLHAAQSHLTATRSAYKSAVSERASTQREVTTLLARQKTWTPVDFERFTTLYRQDYELEALVTERAAELEEAEREAERLGRELGAGILARYHEEQIWSDKIRRMSTWGTWGLMGMNILLFLVFQFGAEPWRRRRLVRGFEEKVREALAEERAAREESERATSAASASAAAVTPIVDGEIMKAAGVEGEPAVMAAPDVDVLESDTIPSPSPSLESAPLDDESPRLSWRETLTDPHRWRSFFADLVSDREIALRMRDVSLLALEGMVAGAAVAGTVTIFISRSP
ncbi:hypothetical protein HD806DRAFT_178413 [Xylariaceae sp. AK1471]|nr:hypothetical protein HD806DRAFT_178413 [Xylariaceae sp. AK1471]